jgi:hypothetical protein
MAVKGSIPLSQQLSGVRYRLTLFWQCISISFDHLLFHSIGICRMRRFLAVLRSFFYSSLLYNFSCHTSQPTILPPFLTSSCVCFLVYLLVLLFPNSYIILFGEFYFLPFSVHDQTNVIYVDLLSDHLLTFRKIKNYIHTVKCVSNWGLSFISFL